METTPPLFDQDDYAQLPEGFPAQLIEGAFVREPAPSYGHQAVQMRLLLQLAPLVPDGLLIAAPTEVAIDEHNVYQPDIVVLGRRPPAWDRSTVGTPRLVIEILSPSSAHRDRGTKARHFLDLGVEEVWLVDPDARTVERRTVDGAGIAQGPEILTSAAVPGFDVVPERLFAAST